MGTDIHCFSEIKYGSEWKLVEPEYSCPYCFYFTDNCPYCDDVGLIKGYPWRNYKLFYFLNEDTARGEDEKITPLDKSRGIPKDISHDLKLITQGNTTLSQKYEYWGDWGTSYAYLYELKNQNNIYTICPFFFGPYLSALYRGCNGKTTNCRIIFNFDS